MRWNLKNNFFLWLNQKKPLSTEQHDLRRDRPRMGEHFYPTCYNVGGMIKPLSEEHTVDEGRATSRKHTVSSPIIPLPLCLPRSDWGWSLYSQSLFFLLPFSYCSFQTWYNKGWWWSHPDQWHFSKRLSQACKIPAVSLHFIAYITLIDICEVVWWAVINKGLDWFWVSSTNEGVG